MDDLPANMTKAGGVSKRLRTGNLHDAHDGGTGQRRLPGTVPDAGLSFCVSMIFSENRCSLFRIMLLPACLPAVSDRSETAMQAIDVCGDRKRFENVTTVWLSVSSGKLTIVAS
ncbi:hypothetical protein LJR220_004768 [Bradyrhizobium sp. LjRoot220]|uniref:hypothetical protein n=1 Tax=Bradyrhizobium sp. LjRoot220 TaxID=3342284 RepID=UPI003ECC9352